MQEQASALDLVHVELDAEPDMQLPLSLFPADLIGVSMCPIEPLHLGESGAGRAANEERGPCRCR